MVDRICGWGPTLAFVLKDDEYYIKTSELVFSHIDQNYDSADTYIKRFEPIRQFYERDCRKTTKEIEDERGKKESSVFHTHFAYSLDTYSAINAEFLCIRFGSFSYHVFYVPQ